MVIGFCDEAVDGGLEVDEGMEDTTFEPPLGEFGEEALDSVEPRAGGGCEVEGEALVTIKPGPDLGMLMGGVVVEDDRTALSAGTGALITFKKRMNS